MSSRDQATVDTNNDHSSQQPSRSEKSSLAGIGDKFSGVVGVIHGTGEVIRGHAMGTKDQGRGQGKGKAIAAAGREEVERGLDKLEGKPARTSTASVATTGLDPNAPQPSTATADPRADPRAEKAREEGAADAGGYPADKGATAGSGGAVGGDVPGRRPADEYRDEQTGSRAAQRDHPAAAVANGRSGQRDPDVEPRAVTASGDPDKQDRDVADAPRYGNTTGHWQEQPRSGTGAQTEGRSGVGPADADSG